MNSETTALRSKLHLHNKRAQKSCGPCRARKVKCSRTSPCVRCVKSRYPELCLYDERTRPSTSASSTFSPQRTHPQQSNDQSHTFARPWQRTEPSHQASVQLNDSERAHLEYENDNLPYLGSNSLPQFLDNEATVINPSEEHVTQQGARDALMPMLGSTPLMSRYPFYGPSESAEEEAFARLHRSMPSSKEIIRLFRIYQTDVHPFMPLLVKNYEFETELCQYVQKRTNAMPTSSLGQHSRIDDLQRGRSMEWISVLFALMACGVQFSNGDILTRSQQSSLYVSSAFEALRLANFMMRPSNLCVQAMLLLGFCLQNDMRPQASWLLLGTTVRMAQSLGLHKARESESSQRLLWLAVIRQDSLICACFDQQSTSPVGTLMLDPNSSTSLSCKAAMDYMTDMVLRSDVVADESNNPDLGIRRDLAEAVDAIKRRTQEIGSNGSKCTDIQGQCEMLHLDLQFGFVKGWICRPALRKFNGLDTDSAEAALHQEVMAICLQSLRECLYGFVRLNSLCNYASRAWSVIHNGLSSSLLLALTGELKRDTKLHAALGELLDMFEDHHDRPMNEDRDDACSSNLSPAYTRAVIVLRKMYLRDKPDAEQDHDTRTMVVGEDSHRHDYPSTVFRTTQTNDNRPQMNASGAIDPDSMLLQGLNFMDGLPPLDAFDSILWPSAQDDVPAAGDYQQFPWL